MAKEKQVAADFQKMITEGRERKQAEQLAAKIFSRDRVSSAPPRFNGPTRGGSLASRVGVKKRGVSSTPAVRPNSLAARIHAPGTSAPAISTIREQRRTEARQNALLQAERDSTVAAQVNLVQNNRVNGAGVGGRGRGGAAQQVTARAPPQNPGMTIRGLAGPYVIVAQNFAPGTTAADIESAMMPVGGLINKCNIVKSSPMVIAEVEFQTKDGADRVIERFNNQLADGRVLHVCPKLGAAPTPATAPRAQRTHSNGVIVDGLMGFEPMEVEDNNDGRTGLYSDELVRSAARPTYNWRGRGFRGGRGGNNR